MRQAGDLQPPPMILFLQAPKSIYLSTAEQGRRFKATRGHNWSWLPLFSISIYILIFKALHNRSTVIKRSNRRKKLHEKEEHFCFLMPSVSPQASVERLLIWHWWLVRIAHLNRHCWISGISTKCVSHQIAAFFKRCCRCSFSSTKLNCLHSAASKYQWQRKQNLSITSYFVAFLHTRL